MKIRSLRRTLLLTTGAMAVAALMSSNVYAVSSYLNAFNNLYGTSGTNLDTCGVCHTNFSPGNAARNAYGADFAGQSGHSGDPAGALQAIEGNDPDGDGSNSISEINAGFMPGWNCTTFATASNAPANLADFVDPGNPGCGTAAGPDISVAPLSLDFGAVTVGTSATQSATVSNTGDTDLTVTGLSITGSGDFALGGAAPATPFTVPAQGSASVPVDYTPGATGADSGSLVIASDDPDTATFPVALAGTGVAPAPNQCSIDASPLALDFGPVDLLSTTTLTTTLRNNGTADCVVDRLTVTSATSELALGPTAPVTPLTIAPGGTVDVPVDYTPVDEGTDAGTLDIGSNDPNQPVVSVPLTGSGAVAPPPGQPGGVDLDIEKFLVTKKVHLEHGKRISLSLKVKNTGSVSGEGTATVVGMQGETEVYREVRTVSDAVGKGAARFRFPSYIPQAEGEILWTATIMDGDPDTDTATASTDVVSGNRDRDDDDSGDNGRHGQDDD